MGASIEFLSVYPKDQAYLYSPFSFIKFAETIIITHDDLLILEKEFDVSHCDHGRKRSLCHLKECGASLFDAAKKVRIISPKMTCLLVSATVSLSALCRYGSGGK